MADKPHRKILIGSYCNQVLSPAQVLALAAAMPPRYALLALLGAAAGRGHVAGASRPIGRVLCSDASDLGGQAWNAAGPAAEVSAILSVSGHLSRWCAPDVPRKVFVLHLSVKLWSFAAAVIKAVAACSC